VACRRFDRLEVCSALATIGIVLTRGRFPRRAAIVHTRVAQGQTILITGIGGGVALIALQLCLAKGANVFVTSGSEDKIQKAIALGAAGGVVYKLSVFSPSLFASAPPFFVLRASSAEDWPGQLAKLLAKQGGSVLLDAVIDSGGGDIMGQVNKILKPGGKVVVYGMYVFTCTHTPLLLIHSMPISV
jgi:NADPH:quinone reductase-like Zn-dependent oxidoreductase